MLDSLTKYAEKFQLDFEQLDSSSVEVYRLFISSPANEIISVNIADDDTGWLTYATKIDKWEIPYLCELGFAYFNLITRLPVNTNYERILYERQRIYSRHIQWIHQEMAKLDVLQLSDIEELSRCGHVSYGQIIIQNQTHKFTSQACDDMRHEHYEGWAFHRNLWELCIHRLRNPLSLLLLQSYQDYFVSTEDI